VFIAACLLDLLPDVLESMDNITKEIYDTYGTKVEYPVAEFIIVMGLLLILIVEQTILYFREIRENPNIPPPTYDENSPLLSNTPEVAVQGGDDHHYHHELDDAFERGLLRSLLLLIALSFHSLFEGLAIGLQSSTRQLISIFMAVIVHKSIMAFSLGLNLAQNREWTSSFLLSVFVFSLASPLGVALGIGLMEQEKSLGRDIGNGVLQGISCGTFLYITFFEVLPHELNSPLYRLPKVLCVIIGFSAICALLFITH